MILLISRVVIVHKPGSAEAERVSKDLGNFLLSRNVKVQYGGLVPANEHRISKEQADLILVVGGDGTIMRVLQRVEGVPLLGVKFGALGFLCETVPEEAESILEKILSGNYYLEYRTRLSVQFKDKGFPDVLNEVVIASSKPSRIISMIISKDGTPIYKGKADGVIVSTTTGSTAYALSAGGAIIDPMLDAMEVVPICPLSTAVRPFVLPISSTVEVRLMKNGSQGTLILDGAEASQVEYECPVLIERSRSPAVFIRVKPPDFYRRVMEKTKGALEV